jgi:hypothetical protein
MPIACCSFRTVAHHARRWAVPGVVVAVLLAAAWVSAGPLGLTRRAAASADVVLPGAPLPRTAPLRVAPTLSLADTLNRDDVDRAVARLRLRPGFNMPKLAHALRVFGGGAHFAESDGAPEWPLVDIALEQDWSKRLFQEDAGLVATREGIHCRVRERTASPRGREAHEEHPDQLLDALAEAGVPLDQRLSTADRAAGTVRDLLADSLSNFNLRQAEIEWSAMAYALYLPPRRAWADKFGTVTTFDDLADELMQRHYDHHACGGTHLLYALTILLRADAQEPVLTDAVRSRVHDHLARAVREVIRSQAPDGTWDWRWHEETAPPDRRGGDRPGAIDPEVLRLTGHHLEWLMLLPTDLLPPRAVFAKAVRPLLVHLGSDPQEKIGSNYCPYSHAGRVLLLLGPPGGAR